MLKTNYLKKEERQAHALHNKVLSATPDMEVSEDTDRNRDFQALSNAGRFMKWRGGTFSLPFNEVHFSSKTIYFQRQKAIRYNSSAASGTERLSFRFSSSYSHSAGIVPNTKYEVLNFNFQAVIGVAAKIACLTISEKRVQPIRIGALNRINYLITNPILAMKGRSHTTGGYTCISIFLNNQK